MNCCSDERYSPWASWFFPFKGIDINIGATRRVTMTLRLVCGIFVIKLVSLPWMMSITRKQIIK